MNDRRTPRSVAFRREREASWHQLEQLCERIERQGLRSLSDKDLLRLPMLHRAALSGLSVAKAISLDRNLRRWLEALAARSHCCVYGMRRQPRDALRSFLLQDFPRAVRALAPFVALASGLLLAGVVTAFVMTSRDLDNYFAFVPDGLVQGRAPTTSVEDLRAGLYERTDLGDGLASFATFLFTHNTQVAILCFALGFAAGLPTAWLLFTTGLMVGGFGALYHARGLGPDLWGWMLPHGITELGAIVLAGAAGLLQGHAVLLPGRRTRAVALRAAGSRGGLVMLGVAGMLVIAALLEGFFRQLVTDFDSRYAVILLTSAGWIAYFGFAGRSPDTREARG